MVEDYLVDGVQEDNGGDRLDQYRAKRDFERTPEPSGGEPATDGALRFVVQEHHATALHWDLRLERNGVLVSWAVPKGIPPDPRENHLAVHTEDHPLSYLDFHGEIPKGEYGGGQMTIWDEGTYECEKWEDREVMVTLHGRRARGRYVLFHTSGNQWMIHRRDPPEDPSRQPMPERLVPAPLTTGGLPGDEEEWSFEPAWGGHRVVVAIEGGRTRALDEAGEDVTSRYPELRELGRAVGAVTVALEGELVVTGAGRRPDPEAQARRAQARGEAALRRQAARSPAVFFAADLVWLEGHSAAPLPYRQRRSLLERLELSGPAWETAPSRPGEGTALLAAARAQGLAGVVARRLDGPYETGSVRLTPAET
jgi:bifunctional non-homologous end joining protein LigD